ncbi:MAG: murein biosynthesis integral membrane protein MurJ [Candidatus Komeilibacteria bacterium]|nr:murein biosynthesis integral membrane protein MurJ [Candidatus Komeilibacteria bacterium]
MLKVFWQKMVTTVSGGAVLIAFFSVVSRLLGLVRDRLLASYFGAGPILDSYYAAFKLPDLIFNTLVLGALASAFIPVFTRAWQVDRAKAVKLANVILNYLLVTLVVLSGLMILFAPQIVPLIVPGFSGVQLEQTIALTRIMLLSLIFFGLSNVVGGILNSLKKFFTFSLAPVFYNLGIIFGVAVLYPVQGLNGLAWGVVLGSLLHFLIQLPEVIKSGWVYQWQWRITVEAKRVFTLMVPRTIGLAANQLNLLIITAIASGLAAGSLAIFNLANNLQSFPISIFGVSLAIAVFPVFSETLASGENKRFVEAFSLNFRRVVFLLIPISIFILLLRAQLVRVILGSGNFDWTDTYYTAQTLGWFTVSLLAQGLIPMLARGFYALEDTKTPVFISLGAIIVNIIGSLSLGKIFGVEGLAMAFSLASILNMIALLLALRLRVGYLDDAKIIWSTLKVCLNSVLAGLAVYGMLRLMAGLVDMTTFLGIFLQGSVAAAVGLLFYFAISLLTNSEEVLIVKRFVAKYLRPLFR